MNSETLELAIAEARRFLRAAEQMRCRTKKGVAGYDAYWGCRESGTVRRASMDLTRALADLRKTTRPADKPESWI